MDEITLENITIRPPHQLIASRQAIPEHIKMTPDPVVLQVLKNEHTVKILRMGTHYEERQRLKPPPRKTVQLFSQDMPPLFQQHLLPGDGGAAVKEHLTDLSRLSGQLLGLHTYSQK